MTTNMKHCLLLLSVVLILLLGIGIVSATDTNNTTHVIKDNNILSTPSNYDVDNVVQSDLPSVKSDADVEKISSTSENTKSTKANKQTDNTETTNDGDITVSNISKDIEKTIKRDGEGTFTLLQQLVNENSVLNLDNNYKFTPGVDDQTTSSLVDGIVISHDITINGNGFTLDGSNLSRIFYINDGVTVNINDVTFKDGNTASSGGAIYTLSTINIENCNFVNNTAKESGGAIWLKESATDTTITDSSFIDNKVTGYNTTGSNNRVYFYGDGGAVFFEEGSSNGVIDNSIFINNSANANGGAIVWNGEYGNITSSKFYNNTAPYAAGAVRLNGKYLLVNNSLFDGNLDPLGNYSWGSAIYLTGDNSNITNSNFTNHNGANTGGAIAIDGSNEILENNIFINNSAYEGGAVFIQKNENVTFNNTTFIDNVADFEGGAILISDHANNTQILNSNFTNNKVTGLNISSTNWIGSGGAIFFGTGCSEGLIDNSTFTNNSANANGGAVLWSGDYGNITRSKFYNNTAPYAGGALRLSGNNLFVNDSLFDKNYDPIGNYSWGSAVYISGNDSNISNSNFTNNYGSNRAGAVYVAGNNAIISDSLFDNNTAFTDGGAVLLSGNNASVISSNFTKNSAENYGGAVDIQGANATISSSVMNDNSALSRGGAVYVNGANATISSSVMNNNTAEVDGGAVYVYGAFADIEYSNFTSNNANWGGAVYVNGANATISHAVIDNNTVANRGGAVDIQGANATIEYSNLTSNSANQGGAVNVNGANATVLSCVMNNNTATADGGAVYIGGTNVIIESSNLTFNNANYGGAVYINGVNATILSSQMNNNSANTRGGAIDIQGANATVSSSVMNYNNATSQGGAIYIAGNNATIEYSNLTSNNANQGGALYLTNGNYDTVFNSNFDNNTARTNGGSIYATSCTNAVINGSNFTNDYAGSSGGSTEWQNSQNVSIINSAYINCSQGGMDSSYGGAVDLQGVVTALIDNCTFINDTTACDGGAINFRNKNSVNSILSNSTFINCSSLYWNGGAVSWKDKNGQIVNNIFINCSAISEHGEGGQYGSGQGGALLMDETAANNLIQNNTFINCTGLHGGAIYYRGSTQNNTHVDCVFINNTAYKDGGALNFKGGNESYINCTFINNTSPTGGSIYYNVNNGLLIANSSFENNTEITDGGFIYIKGNNVTITNTTFYNGSAVTGGAIYISSGNNLNMVNNTFDYNNATTGGAIYIGSAVVINDTIFTNNVAESGGALYVTKDTTLDGCNLTNNNATTGSAVYVKAGTFTIKNSILLDNQAHSKEFADRYNRTEGNQIIIGGVFTGLDNYLNGIYWDGGNVVTLNLEYLGVDGIINTDVSSSTIFKTINETYQLVVLEVYDRYNNLIYEDTNYTAANGSFEFSFDAVDDYDYILYHPENTYYTYLVYTFNKMVANLTVDVTNITFGESESIKINVSSNENPMPTGFVTVYVNNTEGYENLTFDNIPLGDDGTVIIDDAPLDLLNVTSYEVYVRYTGDGNYLSNIETTAFNVTKADPEIIIEAEDISYGYNETVKINITSKNANGNITVKIINSTGDIIDTLEFNLNSNELVAFNLTELIPDTYTINVSYVNDTNYNDGNFTHDFSVIRQSISINELSNIYVDETQLIMGSVSNGTSLVSEGSVIINLSNGTQIPVMLSNGIFLEEIQFTNNGTYIVNASYILHDIERCVSDNTTFNVSKIPTITTVTIVNTTIGHVAINVTVQENVPGKYTGYIQEGVVNITIDGVNGGNPVQYPINAINTTILLDDIEMVGTVPVTVVYNGSYKYLNSTDLDFDHIDVEPIASNLTIEVSPDNITVGDYVVVSGRVYDESGKEITSGTVHITIGTDEYDETVSDDGYHISYHTTEVGQVNVEVHYNGQKDINDNIMILESTNTTEFTVRIKKQETNITVEPLSNVEINKTFNITINLTNSTGSPLSGKNIVVLINKVPIEITGATDENGQITFEYMVHDASDILVEAEFTGDDYYYPSSNYTLYKGPISLLHSNISVEVDNTPILINQTLVISGTLNDSFTNETYPNEFTHPIEGATVVIKVNNQVIGSNITDANGAYSYELNTDNHPDLLAYSAEDYVITVEYGGEPKTIYGSAASTVYRVDKIPTITNVSIINNTAGNVTLNISVAGIDANTSMTGFVNITISGNNPIQVELTGQEYVIVNLKDNMTTVGNIPTTAVYLGNDKYAPSTANISQNEELKNITVVNQTAILSVDVSEDVIINTSSVNIYGTLTDDLGNNISNSYITISIDDEVYTIVKTNSTGGYNITYTPKDIGEIKVDVFYDGNNIRYSNATNTTKFNVTKQNTTIELEVSNINYTQTESINITVNESTATGNVIVDINSTLEGFTNITKVIELTDATAQLNLSDLEAGEYNVTVTYDGNSVFNGNTTSKKFTVYPLADYELNITASNITYGEDEIIKVILPEGSTGSVTISIDGITIDEDTKILTDSMAEFIIPAYSGLVVNEYTVSVTYSGDDNHPTKTNSTIFTVSKAQPNVEVIAQNISYGHNETITVSVDDYNASGVVDITITNSSNEVVYTNNTIDLTQTTITDIVEMLDNGTYTVTVDYYDDDNYENTQVQTTFVVTKQLITLNIDRPEIYVGEYITISGKVTEADGQTLVDEGYVVVKLSNDTEYVYESVDEYFNGVNRQYIDAGEYTAYAVYMIDGVEIARSAPQIFTVNKIPTATTVTVLNNTVNNVTIDVVVKEDVLDKYTSTITDGTIKVVVNGTTVEYPINGYNTTIVLDKINTTEEIEVSVVYNESFKYEESTGVNATNDQEITSIIADPIASNITITTDGENVLVGERVIISGQVLDDMGNVIKTGKVHITVDGIPIADAVIDEATGYYTSEAYTTTHEGQITVVVSYDGQKTESDNPKDLILASTNTTTFNVSKMPTVVTITPISDVEVNKTFTIEVTLTNKTSQAISGKDIIITVNDVELTGINPTDANGKTSITYTPHNNTTLEIKAVYEGNEVYLSSEDITLLDVGLSQSTLTVNVNKSALYASESVNISGKVVDGQGNNLVGAEVTIYVNGERVTAVLTNTNGEYSHPISNLREGEYTVRAVYDGIVNVIIGDEDTTYYSVDKMLTTLDLTVPRNAEVFVPFDIEVTLSNDTDNTNAIAGKTIVITVNNVPIMSVPQTDADGKVVVTYTPQNNSTLVIRATFNEDDYYYMSSATATVNNINLSQSTITVDVNKSALYAGESVNITGKLTDGQNRDIVDAVVKLYINDTFEAIVLTNSTGEYTYSISDLVKGEYTVRAVYEGINNSIIGDEDTESYVVEKMNTTLTLTVPETASVNVPMTIEVTLANNTNNTNPIDGKAIVITVNDVEISNVPLTDADGKVVVSYTPNDNTTLVIKAVFSEDDYYNGSNDTKTIAGENITLSQSSINVSVNKSALYASESVNITGRLVDGQDNIITGADVKIYINDVLQATVQTNLTGEYSYSIDNLTKGEYIVKAVYDGVESVINGSNNTTAYSVDKMPTTVNVVVPENVEVLKAFDIEVTLSNNTDNSNAIAGKTIAITVNDVAISNVPLTGADGKVVVSYTPQDNTALVIKAVFVEDDYYYGNEDTKTIPTSNISLSQSTITVTVNETTLGLGDSVTITGKLTDAQGVAINDAEVTIVIYDEDNNPVNTTTVITDANGEYVAVENNLTVGNYTVNATYNGRENAILPSSDKCEYEVIDYSITINVDRPSIYVDEYVTVFGSVFDGRGKLIENGVVHVVINNSTGVYSQEDYTIVNGIYSKNVKYPLSGIYNVTATYIISDTQNVTSDVGFFNVSKIPTITNVSVINNTVGNVIIDVIVSENVTGQYTDPITAGTINVKVADGEVVSYPITSSNTTIKLDDINTTDEVSVWIEYPGSYKYEPSTGINNTTCEVLDMIKADAKNSSITVEVEYDPTVFTDNVTITGVVYDEFANVIESGSVTVTVDDKEPVTITFTGGKYSYTYTTDRIADDIPVHVQYNGAYTENDNLLIEASTNDTTFNVTRIPTIVTISPISDVEVNKEFTIEVTLTNKTGSAISGKPIIITVNDVAIAGVPETDADGKTSITYTPRDDTALVIKAVYLSDEVYLGNESELTVDVNMSQSTLTVQVDKPALYADDSVNISGKLVDGQSNHIVDGPVTIYINGNRITTVLTDSQGEYSHIINHVTAGEYTVRAVYDGVANAIIGDEDTTYYSVHKMPTNVTITLPDEVEVFVPFDIEVTLTNNTSNHNPISDKPITIKVNGVILSQVPLTDIEGKVVVSYTPQNNSTIVVQAVFAEDEYYLESSDIQRIASENISISESTITVNVNESQLYVDESVEITGRLTDGLDNAIPTADVKIYINEVLKATVETNRNGEYTYVINNLNKGNYNVLVVYEGMDNIIASSNNTTAYNVSKIPTITTVSVINNTEGNVTIDVIVTENVAGRHTDLVIAGALEVTVNGRTQQYPVKGRNSTITLDGRAFINTTDEVTFNVKYVENDKYLSSNGLNSSTGEEITTFNADSQQSTITVTVTPETQTINNQVIISGHVYDGMGTEITSGNIYLTINDNAPIEVNLTDDGYSYEYTADIAGINNVTAVFEDVLTENSNILIKSSTNNTTFTVDKINTTTTVEILNNTVGNVTIDIKVVGADGNTTLNGDVNITIAGKTYPVSLIEGEENLTVKLSSITQAGDIQVSVEYLGNDKYQSSIANNTYDNKELTNITVEKQTANITIDTNVTSCYVGEHVNISGNLTDGMGERITNDYVTINVDGNEFIVKTNSTGGYTLDYQTDRLGEIPVNVSYVNDNFNDAAANKTFNVTKIPTTTSADILNTTLSNVTVEVKVVDVYGNPVDGTIKVRDPTDYTHVLTEATVSDGAVNITIPSDNIGSLDVIIEYQENEVYLASNATNNSLSDDDPNKNITQIDVTRIPTITSVEILNTTLSNVTIKVTVVNQTNESVTKGSISILDEEGNVIADLDDITLDDGQATITLPFDEAKDYRIIVHYNENDVYMASNATNESAAGTADENITTITVSKIPTKTNVTILDTTFNNVTIAVNVTNMTGINVEEGSITIFDRQGNVLVDSHPLTDGLANITIPVEKTGELLAIVHYNENDVYMPSNATNSSSIGALEEITFIDVTKIPTITSVEIISNLINNVTIGVNVTNTSTGSLVEKGQVAVYDTEGNELIRSELTGGKANILIPRNTDGIFEVVVKYIENDIYYNSTAMNESAEAGRENITVIDVSKIATITNVEILNNTIGNVTVHITTTNMTDDAVTKGHVVVRDQNNNIIGEGDLVNGGINLTLNVTTPTLIGVNVTYLENDIYLSSNARNSTLPSGSSDENITYIDVAKQNATITINTNKDVVVIGEDVTIYGTVTDGMGMPISDGIVNISIDGTIYQAELKDGIYTLNNITIAAGVYTVNATYTGNDNISSKVSDNVEFTVNKIPTTTTVEILNNTAGNVTVKITVTNMTGELVKTGEVVIKDADGIITNGNLTDGQAILVIPTENTDTLYVNVSYIENTHYYPSNATNSSSTTPEYENITVIDVVKQNASITIEVVNPNVIMGDVVTIRGQVTDGMGNIVSSGDVDVCVDDIIVHTSIVDGYYTINNQTFTAGVYDVNATYLGNDTVDAITSETVNFTVSKMPTTTVVEVLNSTAGNVTIDVKVTNSTGEAVVSGQFNVSVAGKNITVDVAGVNTTVKLDVSVAGDVACYVDYLENDNYTSSSASDKTSGDIFDNITVVLQNASITVNATPSNAIVYQDVTINGTLIDGMGNPISQAFVEVIVNGTSHFTKTDADGTYSIVYTPLYNGTVDVKVIYDGNTTVNATENTTTFTVDKIATITNVEVINTTLSNVTIRVNVTNSTEQLVTKGSIVVYDTDSNELAKANLTDGIVDLQVPTDAIGPLEVVIKYLENDLYLNSTALNDTAAPGRENITLIDVTRIPTTTSVEILDNIAGNVTLAVNVTNMTGDLVSKGEVYIHNASNYDEILATATLTDGQATIKLDTVIESGLIEVIVEYQENDVYFASNATNESAVGTPDENITVIDVQKQSVTITIELSNSSIIISENTTISGQVFDGMGEVVKSGNVTIYVIGEDTQSEKTVEIIDDKYTLSYTGLIAGNYTTKAKYLGNSSMTPVMSEELNFTVNKIPTKTAVTIINTTLSNVTIAVNVTNLTDDLVTKGSITVKDTSGAILTEGTLTNGAVNLTIPVDKIGELRLIVTYNENNIYNASNATNATAIGTPNEEIIIINVTRIPTTTTVEILNTTINNVTIGVTVTNMTGTGVTTGSVVVTDTSGRILANGELIDSQVTLQLPATTSGPIEVIVTYLENDVYLASNATNESAAGTPRENITVINATKLPTITSVEILNTTLGNVTIGVNVTNMTDSLVNKGNVIVYDKDDNILVDSTPLVNGCVNITVPATIGGELEIRVEYQENDYYYASNATNSSAEPSKQNITVINVTKMPTVTTVDIINHTAGNVTVAVTVTNMTNDLVTEGTVVIIDNSTGEALETATLTDGKANITIDVSNTDTLYVIVQYQENDYYYASNATNSSATSPSDENITVIDVVKQNSTISIELNNNSIVISDSVVISGVVKDELGNVITQGQVLIDIDGFQKTVDITDSKYTFEYTPSDIANYTVVAKYLGNDTVNEATSQTLNFTVGKIPTKTNVTIINTTVGNVTIGVNVVNLTDENVIKGNVTIYDMNGNVLITDSLTGGLANITIPVEHDGQISVVVTYNENDLYLASNATNSSATGTPSEEIIVIDAVKQDADITIALDNDNVTFGDVVTITGTVTDGMGEPIPDGTVTIDIDGQKQTVNVTDGKYTFDYTTDKAGVLPITATYNGKEGVINPVTSENTNLTVNKKESHIVAVQVGNTPGNTSIEVQVTDNEGNPVKNGTVIVTLPDGTNVTAPVVNGNAIVPINTTPGNISVIVTYNGTDEFDKSSTTANITTVKLNTTIPLNKIDDVTIGDKVTINGSLSNQNGVDITNANITITINGKKYNTTTNKAGEYTFSYTTTTSGINNVTVEYDGNIIYNPANNMTNFTVNKKDVVLDVKQNGNTAGNTSIEVKVTDDEGRPVKNGTVIVTLPDGTNVTAPVVNGTATVPLNTEPGSIPLNITYNGTDEYDKQSTTTTITTLKINTTIPIDTIKTVSVGDKVNITGKLLDSNNKTIANANITVKVNNKSYTTTTDSNGVYTLPYTTTTSGVNNVTVSYAGNKTYNPSNNQTNFTVKINSTVQSKQIGSNVGNTTIQVNITDKNGNKVPNGTVTVTDKNGKVIGTGVVKNGTATITLNVPAGKQNITINYGGNEFVNPSSKTQSISVNKNKANITINTIKNITLTQKAQISGKLTDINGNPIAQAKVTLNLDGVTKTVTTDRYGDYTLEYNTTHVGLNNVTAQFDGDDTYNSAKANSTYNASKIITYVEVDDVKGILGDKITLRATVTDEFGTKVTGGQFVFKVNGLTLRTNGKFEATGDPMILSPVNGTVTVTVVADTYLRSAVNITGAYGGNSKYYSSRSIVPGRASLVKRDAQITVTTVKTTKQDVNITLKAVVTDVTGGKNNGPVKDYDDNFVVFKINGITIKNEDGTAKQAKVVNGVATMDYYVPAGLAGKYTNLTDKNYTVMAVFGSGSYNPGVSNTTTFGVERSSISFVNNSVTLNTQTKEMTIKSKIVDYHNNLLKGTNTLCVKINGQTYKINNKTVFYETVDGNVDLNIILPYNVNKINSIELVTGERVGYLGGRYTTTNITRI